MLKMPLPGEPARLNKPPADEVIGTVAVRPGPKWRRFLGFAGPAYLVSVGYMDPGNWATDLAGGSRYGYALLWVILLSSLMAVFLQTLCARLGLVTGLDLAQACRKQYPRPAVIALWLLAEVAIIACDVAEVIGSAIALNLLFKIPLVWGVLLTGFDVLALLALMRYGFRKIEAFILVLVGTVFASFLINLVAAKPDWGAVGRGLVTPQFPDSSALLIAVGILGATVMPHNLYLHSSIVKSRVVDAGDGPRREAVRMSTLDTVIALGGAFFVNAAILILAAAVFHGGGQIVERLEDAHQLLNPMLGGASATLFAIALLASGQSSTVTGTLAGQIVMEGFMHFRVEPWLRRLVTRSLAIIPAVIIVLAHGSKTNEALVFSQVVLSMQLPFAVIPLLLFTSDRRLMGSYANPPLAIGIGGLIAALILGADIYLLAGQIGWAWLGAGITSIAAFCAYVQWIYLSREKQ